VVRILIADNNIELCRILEEFLNRQQDMEVIGLAYNGEQALEKIQEALPNVVILDLTMPQLDGIGVMERLQSMELSRRPRIIILTAFAKDDMVRLLTDMGRTILSSNLLIWKCWSIGSGNLPPTVI
jgi:two-component system response regulator (stage 0 sporulation protein A)